MNRPSKDRPQPGDAIEVRYRKVFPVKSRFHGLLYYDADKPPLEESGCKARVRGMKACSGNASYVMELGYNVTVDGRVVARTRRVQLCSQHAARWTR